MANAHQTKANHRPRDHEDHLKTMLQLKSWSPEATCQPTLTQGALQTSSMQTSKLWIWMRIVKGHRLFSLHLLAAIGSRCLLPHSHRNLSREASWSQKMVARQVALRKHGQSHWHIIAVYHQRPKPMPYLHQRHTYRIPYPSNSRRLRSVPSTPMQLHPIVQSPHVGRNHIYAV